MQFLQFPLLAARGVSQSLHTHECDAYRGEGKAGDTSIQYPCLPVTCATF